MKNNYTISLSNNYIENIGDIHIWKHMAASTVTVRNHLHTYNELEIILSGSGINEYANLDVDINAGSVYIIPPFISHSINIKSDLEIVTISFNDRIVKYPAVLNKIKSGANYCDFDKDKLIEIKEVIDRILYLSQSSEIFANELSSSLLNTLLIEILSNAKNYNPYDLDSDIPQKLKNAIRYINNNLSRNISLTEVADAVKLTPNHLSSIFKKHIGISYVDFVCEQRLEKAKNLMSDRDLSINRISRIVGFNSPAYFTDKFKKRFGLSPIKYRNEIAL